MTKAEREAGPPSRRRDEPARRAIREDLGTTLLVEAAAGTGKTRASSSAWSRSSATGRDDDRPPLGRDVHDQGGRGALRSASSRASRRAARGARGEERARLDAALARLDSAFVGTIHAFCARLLRERPGRGGRRPGLRGDGRSPRTQVARREAWERYAERLFASESPLLPRLSALGMRLEDLRADLRGRCRDNEDVAARDRPGGDSAARLRRARGARSDSSCAAPRRSFRPRRPPGGWSDYQDAVRRARGSSALRDTADEPPLRRGPRRARPRAARRHREAGPLRPAFEALCRDVVEPGARALARAPLPDRRCAVVARRGADYAAWRRRNGRLNFQDLLLLARDLLRDHPHVRPRLPAAVPADPRGRVPGHRPDPGRDPLLPDRARRRRNATGARAVPLPGIALRGRRPEAVDLPLPARGHPDLRRWCGIASSEVRPRAPALDELPLDRAPLCLGQRRLRRDGFFPPRRRRSRPPTCRSRPTARRAAPRSSASKSARRPDGAAGVVEQDSTRVARAIARGRRQRQPAARETSSSSSASASTCPSTPASSRREGIPSELAGGGAFADSEELAALLPLLAALADPDDPVALARRAARPAVRRRRRGALSLRAAGGRFSFAGDPPGGSRPAHRRARARSPREGRRLAATLPPAAAIARVVRAPRAGSRYAAARELGDSRAGNLLKALAAARRFSAEGLDFAGVVAELDRA